jgi:ryanodine receptor 2
MPYDPTPIDTSKATLSDELLRLTERLAENAHDVWAMERLQDGWTFGPNRDDQHKKHPCLVAYGDLSEGEKRIDRNVVLMTLKAILALGFEIRKAPPTN